MVEIPCHCGNTIKEEFTTDIDLEIHPEIYRNIIEGDFMTFHCAECGSDIKTEIEARLRDASKGIDLYFIPEMDRIKYLSGSVAAPSSRVVIGYPELAEKISIAGEELDDRVIEIIKFRLLEKSDNRNIRIYFNSRDSENLVFYIHGLKPDQLGISKIPLSLYRKLESSLDELMRDDEIKLFTAGQYVSVGRISLEG